MNNSTTLLFAALCLLISGAHALELIYSMYYKIDEHRLGEESRHDWIAPEAAKILKQRVSDWTNYRYQAMWILPQQRDERVRLRIFNTHPLQDQAQAVRKLEQIQAFVNAHLDGRLPDVIVRPGPVISPPTIPRMPDRSPGQQKSRPRAS
ncbi:hypothetical protein ANO11243_095800 [Dothideomycetidae sp. 11243]|nr:hypothetical protein ANO11243_095800 [fungal sp. No.11243]